MSLCQGCEIGPIFYVCLKCFLNLYFLFGTELYDAIKLFTSDVDVDVDVDEDVNADVDRYVDNVNLSTWHWCWGINKLASFKCNDTTLMAI